MARFLTKYLLFSIVAGSGCSSEYKAFHPISTDQSCIEKLKPRGLRTSWYNSSIDVVGKHISGLLLIKHMPDSSTRIVFTNEAGVKFLDFEFADDNKFKVHHILKQMDKKPVIRLLQKDFSLMLGIPFRHASWQAWQNENEVYYGVREKKETHYFITGQDCASLHRIESGSRKKRKVSLVLFGSDLKRPDSINLQHHTFAMHIALRKLAKD
jgi:hypothetical protein